MFRSIVVCAAHLHIIYLKIWRDYHMKIHKNWRASKFSRGQLNFRCRLPPGNWLQIFIRNPVMINVMEVLSNTGKYESLLPRKVWLPGSHKVTLSPYHGLDITYAGQHAMMIIPRMFHGSIWNGISYGIHKRICESVTTKKSETSKLEAQGPCTGHRSIIAILYCFSFKYMKREKGRDLTRYTNLCGLNTLPH